MAQSEQPADPAEGRRMRIEVVQGLYRQAGSNGWGAVVAATCLALAMWPFADRAALLAWLGVTLLVVAARIPLVRRYAADASRDLRAEIWARRYTSIVLTNGVCWASASLWLLPEGDAIAVASFTMIVALLAAGSIASQSYHLPAVLGFVALALLPLAARLLSRGNSDYAIPGATLLAFFVFLAANARIQNSRIREAIALRVRNQALIEALRQETAESDLQRARAEQANLAKSRFLAAASHDLRQPMHALTLFSASLGDIARDEEQRAVADKIAASVESLESLFTELLDLSRLDAGFMQPKLSHFPLERVLVRLRARFGPLAAAKGIALSIPSQTAVVRSDSVLLEGLLGNLVDNAIQYTERGSVELLATDSATQVTVAVRDSGIGIPPEYRDRIFDEFFQIGNAERDRRKGLGLGLAIVRRLSDILDHRLALSSTPGEGSCFSLTLPAGDPVQVRPEEQAPAVADDLLRGKVVLVIEDDVSVQQGMRELLGRWGCRVVTASNRAEALAAIGTACPDLLVADLRLASGEAGGDALADVQGWLGRKLPALIVTGDTSVESLLQARRQGYPVLHKPVRPMRLRAALTQLVASAPRSLRSEPAGARSRRIEGSVSSEGNRHDPPG